MQGIEENIQLVGLQSAFDEILQQIDIKRRAGARQSPQALLENQRNIQIVAGGFIEKALVVQQNGNFR